MHLLGFRVRFAALLACMLLAACASQPLTPGSSHVVTSAGGLPAPDTTSASGAYEGVSEYRIGPQDLLTISVFGVPELNQDLRVNTGGNISLPLIGSIQAGGRTIQELEQVIAAKLSANYLQSPQVTVFIKEFTSQRVTVEGAVKKSGIFPITGRTSLLQIIATAGGLDDLADPHALVVFRVIKGQKMAAVFDLEAIRHGAAEDPQIYGDDIVVVDISGSKSAMRRFFQAMPILGIFHPFG
jgi:polysaccharide export outer membrane protein